MNKNGLKYVNDVINDIKDDGGEVLFVTVHGAHLYGTNTEDSDTDYRIVYKPSLESLILGEEKGSYRGGTNQSGKRNTSKDVDVQANDIRKVIKLFSKGEIVMLDTIYAYTNSDATVFMADEYKDFLDKFIESKVLMPLNLSGVLGYIQMQASKYGVRGTRLGQVIALREFLIDADPNIFVEELIPQLGEDILDGMHISIGSTIVTRKGGVKEEVPSLVVLGKSIPSTFKVSVLKDLTNRIIDKYGHRAKLAMENNGIDWKSISHAFRAIFQYKEVVTTGKVNFPFKDSVRDFLIKVKKGDYDFQHVKELMEKEIYDLKGNYSANNIENKRVAEEAILYFYQK